MAFGEYEGKCCARDRWELPEDFQKFFDDPVGFRPGKGGESFADVRKRTGEFLESLYKKAEGVYGNVLITTHGAALAGILNNIRKEPLEKYWGIGVHNNCAVTEVEVKNAEAQILSENVTYYEETVRPWADKDSVKGEKSMAIETAGQQKYADLTAKRIKSLQTGMIVWISLLCLALICSFDNIMLAAIIGCVGIVLAVLNTKARKEFNRKLDRVKDKEEFYRQLAAPDVLELKEEQLLIAKDYVVTVDTDVEIYDLNQMEKLEVGKQGNIKKTLFLTEPDGKRHAILSTTKGDGRQRAFDQVYERLHKRF